MNAEDLGSPTEIVMVHFQCADNMVPFKILQRLPTGYLRST
jgi:hypothetical protein